VWVCPKMSKVHQKLVEKDDEDTGPNPEEELKGNGGPVCCGSWTSGRTCSLCTTNDAKQYGYRNVFRAGSEGAQPTFHVVECVGPDAEG
jgi:hypothetical protein